MSDTVGKNVCVVLLDLLADEQDELEEEVASIS